VSTSTAELFRLDGRVAVVTGASSGLGARFAAVLHGAGAHVVLAARRAGRMRRLADALRPQATVLAGDLRDPAARTGLIDETAERFGRLDVLVNNAGVCDGGPLHDQSPSDLTAVIDLNLVAAVDRCRLAEPLLFARPGSAVVNVASIYGLIGSRSPMAAYNASKGTLIAVTRHLAAQWGSRGVRVRGRRRPGPAAGPGAGGAAPGRAAGGHHRPGARQRLRAHTLRRHRRRAVPGTAALYGDRLPGCQGVHRPWTAARRPASARSAPTAMRRGRVT
jgi:NAD(P)-dependent dehydrogenase (short-subunit alcohol dehydrogenase family)